MMKICIYKIFKDNENCSNPYMYYNYFQSEINILRVRLPQMCWEPREWQKEDVQDRWGDPMSVKIMQC